MKINFTCRSTVCSLVIICLFFTSLCSAQSKSIDWGKDTVSANNATIRKDKFHIYFEKDLRNVTPTVSFPLDKLKSIVDGCAASNVKNIQFIFSVIRPEDTARYFSKHPEISASDRPKVVNRQTLLIKVPRAAAGNISGRIGIINSKFVMAMLASGFMLVDPPQGLAGDGDMYFDIGFICPPPSDCR